MRTLVRAVAQHGAPCLARGGLAARVSGLRSVLDVFARVIDALRPRQTSIYRSENLGASPLGKGAESETGE